MRAMPADLSGLERLDEMHPWVLWREPGEQSSSICSREKPAMTSDRTLGMFTLAGSRRLKASMAILMMDAGALLGVLLAELDVGVVGDVDVGHGGDHLGVHALAYLG